MVENRDKSRSQGTDDDFQIRLQAFRNNSGAERIAKTRSEPISQPVRHTMADLKSEQDNLSVNPAERGRKDVVSDEIVTDHQVHDTEQKDIVMDNFNVTKESKNTRHKDGTVENTTAR